MNPFLVIGLIVLAIIITIIGMKLLAGRKTPAVVARVEAELVEDGWKLLAKTVATVADGSGKKAAVTDATSAMAEHFENVRKLKAAVAALPEA